MRPLLEYAAIVWDSCTNYERDSLEKLQYEAARVVTGLTRSVSIFNLLKEIGWVSLKDRRKFRNLLLYTKKNTDFYLIIFKTYFHQLLLILIDTVYVIVMIL